MDASPPGWLKKWRGDGVITRLMSQELADHFRRVRIPVVNVNDVHTAHGLPTVQSDHRMIGQLAAEHLLDRGFQQFAFCGFTGHEWSRTRRWVECAFAKDRATT